jgi:oligopeptide/dipeptide ABC transporter ATP-binding protein
VNLALIFVTHDFDIVAKMCDRVLVMYAGRAVEIGAVRDIFDRPAHPYTQALLHSMLSVREDVQRLHSISGESPAPWDLPEGCRFAPRCSHADHRCRTDYPPAFSIENHHTVSCWKIASA